MGKAAWLCRGAVAWTGLLMYAQEIEVDTIFSPGTSEWQLPEGWLLPGSVQIEPPTAWRYDTIAHVLRWVPSGESVRVRLRIVSLPVLSPVFAPLPWRALERWDSLMQTARPPPFSREASVDTFTPRISRNGSLIRSLTVGTGQNATLNSAFRLNLEGQVAPDLFLIAALTDENLPFQTAATQSIADFDRVNIGLRWRKAECLLGDLELKETQTHFANFYRNVLGLQFKVHTTRHQARLAFAEAKGQFHTNSFMGQEGRQGPYPLTGKNGERFIPILAGSEKVYVNGVLMQRGQDKDYVIDYTVGEIIFMPSVPITAATRIVVDFEYADRSYARSFIYLSESWTRPDKGFALQASYFRQADNPRRPLDFSLSPEEERKLAELPSGTRQGLLSGIDTLPYESGAIRYAAKDTIIAGERLSYFVLSQNPDSAIYQLSFVFVGAGQGDYIRESSSLNGNVFRWVGPGRGDYRIGRVIPLPTSVEVLSLRQKWKTALRLSWESEINASRASENRFSQRDEEDIALRQTLRWQVLPETSHWQMHPEVSFQYVGAHYQNADRVYEREYGRQWNYNDLGRREKERLIETRFPLSYRSRYRLTPHAGWRKWGDSLQTWRSALLWEGLDTLRGLGGSYLIEYIPSSQAKGTDRWFRQTGRVFYTLKAWQVGTALWTEWRRSPSADSANFRFYEYTPFVRYQSKRWMGRIALQYRREWQALTGETIPGQRLRFYSYMPQMEARYQGGSLSFSTVSSYRIFQPGDTLFRLQPTRTFLSQNTFRLKLQPWEVELFYQLSAEQMPQRQVLFVAVNPGQGTHEWRDLNGDGLQQLQEFIPAINPLIANYIRLQRATGRFIPVVGITAALSGRWQPEKRFKWISYQFNTRLEQRQNAPDSRWWRYLPALPSPDTSWMQWTLLHRQDLFLFRNAVQGDQTFSLQYQLSQAVPLSGLQRQEQRQYTSRSRYNFSRTTGSELLLTYLQRISVAPLQPEMNLTYEGIEIHPQGIYQPSGRWRTSLGLAYRKRWGHNPFSFELWGLRLPFEQRWSWKAGALFSIRLEPALYKTEKNLPPLIQFELLEGMTPGANLLTNVTLSLPLTRYIELSLLYEGRLTREAPPFHSARMQARANF
ncbi:MAG: hypothetical protein RMK19_04790 [Bacteroidia bacterium]|nr:hypothetical protein [Bacteroidia bacterium]MDW8015308.1 hypothetical protein [Bacteroidia bacterium]